MGLIKSKGNMYKWITHQWNPVKGKCYHDCSYCYAKKWGKQKPIRLDENEFKTDLGKDNFIFAVSGCDLFAKNIPNEWIIKTLKYCEMYNKNKYLFQTKNPGRVLDYIDYRVIIDKSVICTTIETNRFYPKIIKNSPESYDRSIEMRRISEVVKTFVTIEPIIDFDLDDMLQLIENCNPKQVNIGADSKGNSLPEPPKEKILKLITELEKFTIVKQKKNLKRLLR